MVKVYVQNKSFKMVGKAREIRAMLREYQQYFDTVMEFTQKNENSLVTITRSKPTPKRTHYYLLFPKNNE